MLRLSRTLRHAMPLPVPHQCYVYKGSLNYKQLNTPHPYYIPPALPEDIPKISNYIFNAQPYDEETNPYGLWQEQSLHTVYRAARENPETNEREVVFVKDLSSSKLDPNRDPEVALCVALEETLATRCMYRLFGGLQVPNVLPVQHKQDFGVTSSEMQHCGTLHSLAENLNFNLLEIIHDRSSALMCIDGKTYLDLGENFDTNTLCFPTDSGWTHTINHLGERVSKHHSHLIRVKQRIAFKLALELMVAHYDTMNSPKNIFMVMVEDPINKVMVACPGMFDLGNCFDSARMSTMDAVTKDPRLLAEYVRNLATVPVDSSIPDLNLHDGFIQRKEETKQASLKRIAELPWEPVEEDIDWVSRHAPSSGIMTERLDRIRQHLLNSKKIAGCTAQFMQASVKKAPTLGSIGQEVKNYA